MAVYLDDNKPEEAEKIVSEAEEIADKIRTDSEKAICKIYIQIMKKVISKGRDYISDEPLRLRNLIKRGQVSEEKKTVFQQKMDVLKVFKKYMEEENH